MVQWKVHVQTVSRRNINFQIRFIYENYRTLLVFDAVLPGKIDSF